MQVDNALVGGAVRGGAGPVDVFAHELECLGESCRHDGGAHVRDAEGQQVVNVRSQLDQKLLRTRAGSARARPPTPNPCLPGTGHRPGARSNPS